MLPDDNRQKPTHCLLAVHRAPRLPFPLLRQRTNHLYRQRLAASLTTPRQLRRRYRYSFSMTVPHDQQDMGRKRRGARTSNPNALIQQELEAARGLQLQNTKPGSHAKRPDQRKGETHAEDQPVPEGPPAGHARRLPVPGRLRDATGCTPHPARAGHIGTSALVGTGRPFGSTPPTIEPPWRPAKREERTTCRKTGEEPVDTH